MGIRGAWERGIRKAWTPVINLGSLGFMCSFRGDTRSCFVAFRQMKTLYGIAFNQARCTRNYHNNQKGRLQCHIKYKKSKTTDFECFVTNTSDMSGAAIAKCRSPWGKRLELLQKESAPSLMAEGIPPYGAYNAYGPGMSGQTSLGMSPNMRMQPFMGMQQPGAMYGGGGPMMTGVPPYMGMPPNMGMSPNMGMQQSGAMYGGGGPMMTGVLGR